MNHLAILAEPGDPARGLRHIVGMIEAGRSLADLGLESDWEARLGPELNKMHTPLYDLTSNKALS